MRLSDVTDIKLLFSTTLGGLLCFSHVKKFVTVLALYLKLQSSTGTYMPSSFTLRTMISMTNKAVTIGASKTHTGTVEKLVIAYCFRFLL